MDWKPIRAADITAIERVADAVHPPHLYESPAAFQARITMGEGFCYGLSDGEEIGGYLIAHPWGDTVSKLGLVPRVPRAPKTLLLHDLALLPSWRGKGYGRAIVEFLKPRALDALGGITLVAIDGTGAFWRARGFQPLPAAPGLDSYGDGAERMGWTV